MALVKRQAVVNRSMIIAIVVVVVLVGGFFVAQRLLNGPPETTGVPNGGNNQIVTDFGESILDDPRFTELQQFGHDVTLDSPRPSNPNPFQ